MANFFAGTHGRPTWRKAGVREGFRQVGLKPHQVRKLSRRGAAVWVPKAGWVRFLLAAGWGRLVERLEHKAPGRVIKVDPAYTSQTCSACGRRDAKARESQAVFACPSCGVVEHAD